MSNGSSDWRSRHLAAILSPADNFERSVRDMLYGWQLYALAHRRQYGSSISDDQVLGPHWREIGEGIIGLLNGETGRLDCGTLDAIIRQEMASEDDNSDCKDMES